MVCSAYLQKIGLPLWTFPRRLKEGVAIITKTASPKKAIFLAPQKILPNFLSNFFQATF